MSVPFRAAALAVTVLGSGLLAQDPVTHPQAALWAGIKRQLTGPDAEQYFENDLKGTLLPPLRGTVVGMYRAGENRAVLLNLSGGTAPEVQLLLINPQVVPRKDEDITFAGSPVAFTREPFLLTMEVDQEAARLEKSNCGGMYPVHQNYGPPLGKVLNGRYHHNLTGIEFDLPPGWCVQSTLPSFDNSEIAILSHADFPEVYAAVWMIRDRIPLAKIPARSQAAIPEIIKQRSDFEKYAIRANSVDSTWISAQQALRANADYEQDGKPMSETLTWIYSEHTRAFFFARGSATEMPALQTRFDQIIYSAKIP